MERKENLKKETVWIFDLDGTLFESHHQIILSVNEARKQYNFNHAEHSELFPNIGPPVNVLFDDLGLEADELQKVIDFFRQDLRKRIASGTPLFAGVEELLRILRESGYLIAIATSKPDDLAELMVEISPICQFVDFVKGSSGIEPKPNPEVISRVLEHLGAQSGVMVGDRVEDIQAANGAGIPSIGIAQGSHTQLQLSEAGATLTFESVLELNKAVSSGSVNLLRGN
jgi:phosphoglycolate phosphatase